MTQKKRYQHLDIMKIVFLFLMILNHVIAFYSLNTTWKKDLCLHINVIVYSGFMFCLGQGMQIAYFDKTQKEVAPKLIKHFLTTMAIYYCCGIFFFCMPMLSMQDIIDVLLLRKVVGYTEFIFSMAVVYLIVLVFFNLIQKIISDKKWMILAIAVCLVATLLPYQYIKSRILTMLIGGVAYETSYPFLQYAPYFLLGAHLQKNKVKYNLSLLIATGVGTGVFVLYRALHNWGYPERFPPDIFWVLGGALFVYAVYLISLKLSEMKWFSIKQVAFLIELMGSNMIVYLFVSTIFLFATRFMFDSWISIAMVLLLTVGIMFLSTGFAYVRYLFKKRQGSTK